MRALSLVLLLVSAGTAAAGPDLSARIDSLLEARWKAEGIAPAGPADDATFLRRVWLDLAGQVPPGLKAREFFADPGPDKRHRLIDELLASPEFAEHWGRAWAQMLTERRPYLGETHDGAALGRWLGEQFAAGRPYGAIAGELAAAQGAADTNGAVNFLLRFSGSPVEAAGGVGKHLLGTTIHCAQCHDHPLARWKKDEFWSLAALLGRARRFTSETDGVFAIIDGKAGEVFMTGPDGQTTPEAKPVVPRLPDTDAPAVKGDRRKALAAWLADPRNPLVARHAVNLAWGQVFGRRLAVSLDHLDTVAKSTDGPLLELLAEGFREAGHDLKALLRAVVRSRAYGLAATPGEGTEVTAAAKQLVHHARFPTRALSIDQVYASVGQATGHRPEELIGSGDEPAGEEMLDSADHPAEQIGDHPAGVQRALALLTGEYIEQAVVAAARQAVALHGKKPGAAHVEWVYLTTLSRRPDAEELAAALELIRTEKKNRGLEDVVWALLNSVEFNTNH